jgi:hypothetical protein
MTRAYASKAGGMRQSLRTNWRPHATAILTSTSQAPGSCPKIADGLLAMIDTLNCEVADKVPTSVARRESQRHHTGLTSIDQSCVCAARTKPVTGDQWRVSGVQSGAVSEQCCPQMVSIQTWYNVPVGSPFPENVRQIETITWVWIAYY